MAITLSILDLRSVHNKNWHKVGKILDAISAFHMGKSLQELPLGGIPSPSLPFLSLPLPFPISFPFSPLPSLGSRTP